MRKELLSYIARDDCTHPLSRQEKIELNRMLHILGFNFLGTGACGPRFWGKSVFSSLSDLVVFAYDEEHKADNVFTPDGRLVLTSLPHFRQHSPVNECEETFDHADLTIYPENGMPFGVSWETYAVDEAKANLTKEQAEPAWHLLKTLTDRVGARMLSWLDEESWISRDKNTVTIRLDDMPTGLEVQGHYRIDGSPDIEGLCSICDTQTPHTGAMRTIKLNAFDETDSECIIVYEHARRKGRLPYARAASELSKCGSGFMFQTLGVSRVDTALSQLSRIAVSVNWEQSPNLMKGTVVAKSLADTAARFVRAHRIDHQNWELTADHPVCLTVIYQQWAKDNGRPVLPVNKAPAAVIRAVEQTMRGKQLFEQIRDGSDVAYQLRREYRNLGEENES